MTVVGVPFLLIGLYLIHFYLPPIFIDDLLNYLGIALIISVYLYLLFCLGFLIQDKDEFQRHVIALAASHADAVKAEFERILQQRNIPLVSVQHFSDSGHEFVIIRKTFEKGEEATSAVRIEPFGRDLVVEIRQYEWSSSASAKQKFWGTILTVGGLIFVWTGVGAFAFLAGLYLLFTHPELMGANKEEANAFREAVRESISMAFDTLNIRG